MPKKITELFDVEVDTVGLVKRGANRKRFFLMKSDQEVDMEDAQEKLQIIEELEKEQEDEVTHSSWQKVLGLLKAAFTPAEVAEEVEEEIVEETPVEKSDMEVRLEALEKSHEAKLADIQKAHDAELEKSNSRITELEKSARMKELVEVAKSAGMEAEDLYQLEKASPELFGKVTEAFETKEAQLKEAGVWSEIGSSQTGETDQSKRIMARAAELQKSSEVDANQALFMAVEEMGGYDEYRKQNMSGGG